MNPNYVHTITLYRKQPDGSFLRTVHHGCFWKSDIAVTQSGTSAAQSNIYTVRIPAAQFRKEQAVGVPWLDHSMDEFLDHGLEEFYLMYQDDQEGLSVSPGNDFVVYGECTDEVTNTAGNRVAEILNRHKPNAFKITAFSDNTGHPMDKHYRLGG